MHLRSMTSAAVRSVSSSRSVALATTASTKHRHRRFLVLLLAGTSLLAVASSSRRRALLLGISSSTSSTASNKNDGEPLRAYDFPPGFTEPPHLTPLDPTILIPSLSRGLVSIDDAHRHGLIHLGSVLYIVDPHDDDGTDGGAKVLLLRRGSNVVTCPDTWSVVGEHRLGDEDPTTDTVRRAMVEELGIESWNAVDAISNLTAFPLYYIRHYGPELGNRIDRQVTYLFRVTLKKRREDIRWVMDEEVAGHKWVSPVELERWLKEDMARTAGHQDFCHETIHRLYLVGVEGLKQLGG